MTKVYLKVPSKNELHFRQKWMQDKETMSYNAGYDMDLKGYDKETGIIVKTDEKMLEWFNNWIGKEPDKYFAYVFDKKVDEPVGEVYYYPNEGIHSMGIVIYSKFRGKDYSYYALIELEKVAFEKNGINELSDIVPLDRDRAIDAFKRAGFIHTDKSIVEKKFGKETAAQELLITKEMYNKKLDK